MDARGWHEQVMGHLNYAKLSNLENSAAIGVDCGGAPEPTKIMCGLRVGQTDAIIVHIHWLSCDWIDGFGTWRG